MSYGVLKTKGDFMNFSIQAPTYTQMPNDLLDKWLPHLKEVELKVLLFIIRKTIGWHKIRDQISLSQLQTATGATQTNVINAAKDLIKKGLIRKIVTGKIGSQVSHYELIINEESNNSYPSQISRGTPPKSRGGTPPKLGDTKETLKENKTTTSQKEKVVAVVSDEDKKKQEENINELHNHLMKIAKKCGDQWKIPIDLLKILARKYGYEYLIAQVNNMISQEEKAAKSQSNAYTKTKTKKIENPTTWIKLSCEKNYAMSEKH